MRKWLRRIREWEIDKGEPWWLTLTPSATLLGVMAYILLMAARGGW